MWSVPGGRLNKKDGLTRYGDSHVKDKTYVYRCFLVDIRYIIWYFINDYGTKFGLSANTSLAKSRVDLVHLVYVIIVYTSPLNSVGY